MGAVITSGNEKTVEYNINHDTDNEFHMNTEVSPMHIVTFLNWIVDEDCSTSLRVSLRHLLAEFSWDDALHLNIAEMPQPLVDELPPR